MTVATPSSNPLAGLAERVPAGVAAAASAAARAGAVALAIYIAWDQDYDPTRALAGVVATLALLSVTPTRSSIRGLWQGAGAGVLFFSGALLAEQAAGAGLMAVGAVAFAAALIERHQAGREAGSAVLGFFAGLGIVALAVFGVVVLVDG